MKFSHSKSPKALISKAVAAAGAVLLMSGCTMNATWNVSPAVAPVPPGSELLSFDAPGLAPQSALRAEYKDNHQEEEYALFRGPGGAQAEIISVEASSYGYGAQGGDKRRRAQRVRHHGAQHYAAVPRVLLQNPTPASEGAGLRTTRRGKAR